MKTRKALLLCLLFIAEYALISGFRTMTLPSLPQNKWMSKQRGTLGSSPALHSKSRSPLSPLALSLTSAKPVTAFPLSFNPISKSIFNKLILSSTFQYGLSCLPTSIRHLIMSVYPSDLLFFIVFQLSFAPLLRLSYYFQTLTWKVLGLGKPNPWEESILGFVEEKSHLLSKLIGLNYLLKVLWVVLTQLGLVGSLTGMPNQKFFINLISRISYTLYLVHFIDHFKSQFLKTFIPSVAENRRQNYIMSRSLSVIIWIVGALICGEMISSHFQTPLSSVLAFGGVGGIVLGLSAKDITSNFLGGFLLLLNEPFAPGDMVSFKTSTNAETVVGRVERVGWGQTRIRGRDTRPTYIPNSHFIQTAVTNMERITHRKYETNVKIRHQDYAVLPQVIQKIKENLKNIPKLDLLSQPFRISFVNIGDYFLEIEVCAYFATKSIDEFLQLQQQANMEVIKAIQECNADLALPTSTMRMPNEIMNKLSTLVENGMSGNNNNNQTMISAETTEQTARSDDVLMTALPVTATKKKSSKTANENSISSKPAVPARRDVNERPRKSVEEEEEYLRSSSAWDNEGIYRYRTPPSSSPSSSYSTGSAFSLYSTSPRMILTDGSDGNDDFAYSVH